MEPTTPAPDTRARVAVVDHDDLMRASLVSALRRAGYDVVEAADGDAALRLLDEQTCDVVLMDSILGPGPTGFDVLRVLRNRSRGSSTIVLLMVAEHQDGARVRALEAGATDYVTMPAMLPELLARIRAQLDRRDQWMRLLDDRLVERQRLSQALADLPDDALPLEQQLRAVLGAHLDALEVRLRPDLEAVGDRPSTRPVTAAVHAPERDGTLLRLPLHVAATPAGVLEVVVAGDGARALATLTDLGPQLGSLARSRAASADVTAVRAALEARLAPGGLRPVYQPIVDLTTGRLVGHEGLVRFADGCPPDVAFAEARAHGLDHELELAALERLVADSHGLPDDTWLSVNLSAATFVAGDLHVLTDGPPREMVVELTEHEHVEDYADLRARRASLPHVRLAVDDLGSGYASLRHLLELQPDFTKLDRDWIRGIADDPVRRALVGGVVGASGVSGATVVGEGVETPAEARMLRELGVHLGQGWLFGRPGPASATAPGSSPAVAVA